MLCLHLFYKYKVRELWKYIVFGDIKQWILIHHPQHVMQLH